MKEIFLIFLDIDGVLDNMNYWEECFKRHKVKGIMSMRNFPLDPKCLNNLMKLNQELEKNYEVKIILSSTWRLNEIDTAIVNHRLAEYGMRVFEKTGYSTTGKRGIEIQEYLDHYKNYKDYLVLDDDVNDIIGIIPEEKVIKTYFESGFNDEKLQEALKRIEVIN